VFGLEGRVIVEQLLGRRAPAEFRQNQLDGEPGSLEYGLAEHHVLTLLNEVVPMKFGHGAPWEGGSCSRGAASRRTAENEKHRERLLSTFSLRPDGRNRLLDSGFVERGTLQVKRLRRAAVIAIFPWNAFLEPKPKSETAKKERRDPLKTAHYYQSLLDTGKFESRAALARYLGVSRARVTQVLKRI